MKSEPANIGWSGPARNDRARLVPVSAIALFLWLALPTAALAEPYRDLTLEQAIDRLEQGGLSVLYSSDLIKPWMRVLQEPSSIDARSILEEILAPYDLKVTPGPNGLLLLVRAQPPDPAATGAVTGTVRRIADGAPVAGASVALGGDGPQATTDANGRFAFESIPAGRYALQVRAELLQPAKHYVADIRPGETSRLLVQLFDVAIVDLAQLTVTASRYEFVRDATPSLTSFTAAELQLLPDIGDDPLRAVARLPGTATGSFTAKSNVRGGDVDETLVRFDGLRLYNPFHFKDFQSLFSTVDPGVVRAMDVYTGGFPVAFGDRMSSVIDIEPLEPAEQAYREVSLSLFNASGLVAGRFADGQGDWLLSGRRGTLDLLIDLANRSVGEPSYVDLYGRVRHSLSDTLAISGNFLRFVDDIKLFDGDREEEARANYRDEYFWLRLDFQPSARVAGELMLGRTQIESDRRGSAQQPGISRGMLEDRRFFSIDSLQTDWSWRVADRILWQFGGDWRFTKGRYDYFDEVQFDLLFVAPGAAADTSRTRQLGARPDGTQYGAYSSLRVEISEGIVADAGLRWDRETLSADHDEHLSPRVSLLYRLGGRTRLRTSWGRFYQAQAVNELQISDGVAEFFPAQRSDHLLASLEYRHDSGVDVRLEAYRKDYQKLRPRFENLLNSFILLPELKPDRIRIAPDTATAEGAELSLRRMDGGPLSWWLSYTWSSVEDETAGIETLRTWDQTHAVSGGIAWQGPHWELSVAGTYHTGWPTTEVELVDAEPIPLAVAGPRNGRRMGAFIAIDARVARKFLFERAGSLTLFLEASNLLNRTSDCCVEYELADPEDGLALDVERIESLPLLPSLGFVWRF